MNWDSLGIADLSMPKIAGTYSGLLIIVAGGRCVWDDLDKAGMAKNQDHDIMCVNDIITTGAAAYAALEWASFSSNRLNVGGDDVWGRYMEFANVRLTAFKEQLRRLPAAKQARTARMYRPVDARFTSQATDPGPV